MRARLLVLAGLFAALGFSYIVFFTEWISPEPIQIASQVRASILQPRFGRPAAPRIRTSPPSANGEITLRTNVAAIPNQARRVRLPDWGQINEAPGGVANVTFSLDSAYVLTRLRVQDVPADGSAPKVFWELSGKSRPTSSLLYGRDPAGMQPLRPGAMAEPLTPGVPYRLIIEAGRRRGTNDFLTLPSPAL